MNIFLSILSNNIISIFTLIFIGYFIDKKFKLDIYTMSKLNFYILVPVFMFVNLYTTDIPKEMIRVILFGLIMLLINYIIGIMIARIRNYDTGMKYAFVNSLMFYNSGNIGIPLITLVFSNHPFIINGQTPYLGLALTTQIMILVIQNISTNTLGFINAGRVNGGTYLHQITSVLKMPTIYAIPIAFISKTIPYDISVSPIWPAFEYIKAALVPVALLTLGIQLSKTKIGLGNKDVYQSVFIRLIGGPLLALLLIRIMGFEGIFAHTLLISSSVPTAVNTALIAVECKNHPGFSSRVVMISTILSAVTLTLVIYLARVLFPLTG